MLVLTLRGWFVSEKLSLGSAVISKSLVLILLAANNLCGRPSSYSVFPFHNTKFFYKKNIFNHMQNYLNYNLI